MKRARTVMDSIWRNFHDKREANRSGAYRQLLADLTEHGGALVPAVIGLKDFVGLCMNIEEYLKGNSGEQGRNPLEVLRDFLTTPTSDPEPPPDSESRKVM